MSTYELLNHEPDQCLWGQKADADLEQGSRPSITHYVTAEKLSSSLDIPNLLFATTKNVPVMKKSSFFVAPHHSVGK